MKNLMLAFMAALTLASCASRMAVAQMPSQSGMFGNPVLGQPPAPTPRMFAGGATPWRNTYQSVIDQTFGASPAVQLASPSQQPGGAVQVGTPWGTPTPAVRLGPPAQSPQPWYNTPWPSPEQLAGMALDVATRPVWNFALGRGGSRATSASAARVEPYTRSPALSDRLTRIAHSRGMLTGQAIDVYLSGNVALVKGAVRTGANRVLLGNVLGLEPNVSRIDNRLAVEGSGRF